MKILISGLRSRRDKATLLRFCSKACGLIPALRSKGELNLIFVKDAQISKINRKFLNHAGATDVIAFPYEGAALRGENTPFGDIYVSLDTARREAKKRGYKTIQELALYSLHGMLHLAGFDDHSPRKRKKMFAEQSRIFGKTVPRLAPPDFI